MLRFLLWPGGGCSAEFGDGGQEVSWEWLCLPSSEPTCEHPPESARSQSLTGRSMNKSGVGTLEKEVGGARHTPTSDLMLSSVHLFLLRRKVGIFVVMGDGF